VSTVPTNALRVLLVTASEDELRAFGLALHRDGVDVTRVGDLTSAAEALHTEDFDAAIVSNPLPDTDVIGCCAALAAVPATPPILMIDALDLYDQTIPASILPARFLRKPVEAAKLVSELGEMLAEAGASAARASTATQELTAALLELAKARETGVLEVEGEGSRTRIFLRDGEAVSAEGGSLRETLGRMLLRHGALSEADYTRVIDRMTERVMANEHQRMGEVLVELGLLTGEEVHAALRKQVREKVTACFKAHQPSWSFSELDRLPEGLEPFALPPMASLVLEGLQQHVPDELLTAWLAPHATSRPRLRRAAAEEQERLQLDAAQLRLLERLDGRRSLAALGRETEEAPALLATLLMMDALDLDAEAPQKPGQPGRRPGGQFAREVVGRRKSAGSRREASADDTPAAAPSPTDAGQARLEAEQCFRRGREMLANDKPLEAAKLLRRAVALEPGEPEYAMAEAWATYLEARHTVRVTRAKALAAARRLLDADPKAAKAHTTLGRLALEDGDHERATREFELALLRDPEDVEAKKGLKQSRRAPGAKT
jgi:tetratricopeptide (TPR) repeat protein